MELIIIIIVHELYGDTSLKQNFRAAVNVTYLASVNAAVAASVCCRTICETVPSSMHA